MRNANLPNKSVFKTTKVNGKTKRERRMMCIGGPLNGQTAAISELPIGEYHIMNFGGHVFGTTNELRREYSGALLLHWSVVEFPADVVRMKIESAD